MSIQVRTGDVSAANWQEDRWPKQWGQSTAPATAKREKVTPQKIKWGKDTRTEHTSPSTPDKLKEGSEGGIVPMQENILRYLTEVHQRASAWVVAICNGRNEVADPLLESLSNIIKSEMQQSRPICQSQTK